MPWLDKEERRDVVELSLSTKSCHNARFVQRVLRLMIKFRYLIKINFLIQVMAQAVQMLI